MNGYPPGVPLHRSPLLRSWLDFTTKKEYMPQWRQSNNSVYTSLSDSPADTNTCPFHHFSASLSNISILYLLYPMSPISYIAHLCMTGRFCQLILAKPRGILKWSETHLQSTIAIRHMLEAKRMCWKGIFGVRAYSILQYPPTMWQRVLQQLVT